LHDVLNERKIVDYFFPKWGKTFLVLFSEGKKRHRKNIMDNIKFQFDQVIGDCVKNVFLVE
jgi:hypothetical protein